MAGNFRNQKLLCLQHAVIFMTYMLSKQKEKKGRKKEERVKRRERKRKKNKSRKLNTNNRGFNFSPYVKAGIRI